MRFCNNRTTIFHPSVFCIVILLPATFIAGCARTTLRTDGTKTSRCRETKDSVPTITGDVFGYSVRGRPIRYVKFGNGDDISLVFGAIHGDEPASNALALGLKYWLEDQEILPPEISIVIVPALNPDGLAANTRGNVNGVDLNRNFPARNRKNNERYGHKPLSEPESKALYDLMKRYPPNRIISIHQPLACIDYDGPALKMAESMAAVCDLPVRKLGARPGSFGSYAGVDRGIPTVTLELRRNDENQTVEQLWERYGKAVLAGISLH